MLYELKPQQVNAELYHEGLEDGFECSSHGCGIFDIDCIECKFNTHTPFVVVKNDVSYYGARDTRRQFVDSNDFIVTHTDGSKEATPKGEFLTKYQPCK